MKCWIVSNIPYKKKYDEDAAVMGAVLPTVRRVGGISATGIRNKSSKVSACI
jgi:hypothetical protein